MDKTYISPGELLADAYTLGWRVFESGFRPDLVVGIWRGGTPVAIAVHELLCLLGTDPDHIAIRTRLYAGIGQRRQRVQVDGLDYLVQRAGAGSRVLLVDDVFDTGLSLEQVVQELAQRCGEALAEVRIATPWYKPGNVRTGRSPDYFLHETADWLVFPHELEGLSPAELAAHKPELAPLLDRLLPHLAPADR